MIEDKYVHFGLRHHYLVNAFHHEFIYTFKVCHRYFFQNLLIPSVFLEPLFIFFKDLNLITPNESREKYLYIFSENIGRI